MHEAGGTIQPLVNNKSATFPNSAIGRLFWCALMLSGCKAECFRDLKAYGHFVLAVA